MIERYVRISNAQLSFSIIRDRSAKKMLFDAQIWIDSRNSRTK